MVMGIFGGVGLLMCAAVIYGLTASAAQGSTARNGAFGIRTKATMASDEAWLAGHRAALAPARVLAVFSSVVGVAMIVVAALDGGEEPTVPVIILFAIGYVGMLVGSVQIARVASAAARAADQARRGGTL